MPAFFGPDEFPEPEVVEVEAPDDNTVPPVINGLTGDGLNDASKPVATGAPHAMTAAERQVLELEATALEERRRQRLQGVRGGLQARSR